MSKSIDRYVKLQGGYAVKSSDYRESGIPLIRISNVSSNGIDKTNVIFVPKQFSIDFKEYLASEDDTLIAMSGATTGKCCLVKQDDLPCIINQRVGRFLINDPNEVDKKFVYYIISSYDFQNELLKDAVGGAQPNVSPKQIEKINWDFPLYNQQRKIARILSTTDTVIEKTQAAIAKYKAIKQGMLHDLFTRGIDIKTGKLRPKQADAPELYKESELGWIPREWDIKKVEELIECPIRDFGSFSMTNLITFLEHGVLFIKTEAIQDGYIDYNKVSYISKEVHQLLHKSIVNKGDVLFTKIGAIGRVAIYDSNEIANSNAASAKINFNDENNKYYLAFKLNSNRVMREFERTIISTPPRINLGDINKMKIEIPQKNEQDKIASIIKNINNKIISEQSFLNKQLNLKSGLMADLLSGKKLVTVNEELETQIN